MNIDASQSHLAAESQGRCKPLGGVSPLFVSTLDLAPPECEDTEPASEDIAVDWSESVHVWYRFFKWTKNRGARSDLIPLPNGYYFDLWKHTVRVLLESCQKSQNRNRAEERRVRLFQFYQRWLDPVILPCGGFFLACFRGLQALVGLLRR